MLGSWSIGLPRIRRCSSSWSQPAASCSPASGSRASAWGSRRFSSPASRSGRPSRASRSPSPSGRSGCRSSSTRSGWPAAPASSGRCAAAGSASNARPRRRRARVARRRSLRLDRRPLRTDRRRHLRRRAHEHPCARGGTRLPEGPRAVRQLRRGRRAARRRLRTRLSARRAAAAARLPPDPPRPARVEHAARGATAEVERDGLPALAELAHAHRKPVTFGRLVRDGHPVPATPNLHPRGGDLLTVVGEYAAVQEVISDVGFESDSRQSSTAMTSTFAGSPSRTMRLPAGGSATSRSTSASARRPRASVGATSTSSPTPT